MEWVLVKVCFRFLFSSTVFVNFSDIFTGNSAVYSRVIEFFKQFRQLAYDIKVGEKRSWKPWQAAIILSTDAILRLQDKFLNELNYQFLLTSRFTQDCLENVFAQVRIRFKRPTALQFKDALKMVAIAQYMDVVETSSYHNAESDWLIDFGDKLQRVEKPKRKPLAEISNVQCNDDISLEIVEECSQLCITNTEHNALYYISGIILNSLNSNAAVCANCMNSCIADENFSEYYVKYTEMREYSKNALVFVNEATFNFFLELEEIFRKNIDYLIAINFNIDEQLYNLMKNVQTDHILQCHNLKEKIIRRFIQLRLKISQRKKIRENRNDSRSMAV